MPTHETEADRRYFDTYGFALHIGLSPADTDRFILEFTPPIDSDGTPADVLVHGDGWEEWGEGDPAEQGAHVVIEVTCRAHAFAVLDALMDEGWHLLPMQEDYQRGCIAALTLSRDWAESVFGIEVGPVWRGWDAQNAAQPAAA